MATAATAEGAAWCRRRPAPRARGRTRPRHAGAGRRRPSRSPGHRTRVRVERSGSRGTAAGMRVVVIGATGNVGLTLVDALAADPAVDSIVGVARRVPEPDARLLAPKVTWRA